jgi:hypothetical protein
MNEMLVKKPSSVIPADVGIHIFQSVMARLYGDDDTVVIKKLHRAFVTLGLNWMENSDRVALVEGNLRNLGDVVTMLDFLLTDTLFSCRLASCLDRPALMLPVHYTTS